MKFGMLMFPYHHPTHNATLQLDQDLALAAHADSLGFDEFWFGEHHSGGWQIISDPLQMVAAAGQRTSRIKLGSGVSTLSYHHPKVLLDSVIQLDHLLRGRLMFGVGSGALALDAEMMGHDPLTSRAAMAESLDVMMQLLAGEGPITRTSQFRDWSLHEAFLHLTPYSDPLDIRVAAFNSASGPRLAGKYGLGLISFGSSRNVGLGKESRLGQIWEKTRFTAQQQLHDGADRSRWSVMSPIHIAATEKEARRQVRFGLVRSLDYVRQILPLNIPVGSDLDDLIDTVHLAGSGLVGTAEMAIEHIEKTLAFADGPGTFLIEHADWADHHDTRASMEIFAREVVPHFTGVSRARIAAHSRELSPEFDQHTRRIMAQAQAKADLEHSMEVRTDRQRRARDGGAQPDARARLELVPPVTADEDFPVTSVEVHQPRHLNEAVQEMSS